jgi:hypothetical protein
MMDVHAAACVVNVAQLSARPLHHRAVRRIHHVRAIR